MKIIIIAKILLTQIMKFVSNTNIVTKNCIFKADLTRKRICLEERIFSQKMSKTKIVSNEKFFTKNKVCLKKRSLPHKTKFVLKNGVRKMKFVLQNQKPELPQKTKFVSNNEVCPKTNCRKIRSLSKEKNYLKKDDFTKIISNKIIYFYEKTKMNSTSCSQS